MFLKVCLGVPAEAQWVKNLTAVAQVASEVQVRTAAWNSRLRNGRGAKVTAEARIRIQPLAWELPDVTGAALKKKSRIFLNDCLFFPL